MKITKLGHCCLVIEEAGIKLLTDPGAYSTAQSTVTEIDAVLITHEHPDHLHVESLKQVIANNPGVVIITNTSVAAIIQKEKIESVIEIVEHGQSTIFNNISIEGIGLIHADIYSSITPAQNTGYFIAGRFFYPGDAFTDPEREIEILALPVAGPWMKLSEAIDYAKKVKPKNAFPVHDGMLIEGRNAIYHNLPKTELEKEGIKFIIVKEGESLEV